MHFAQGTNMTRFAIVLPAIAALIPASLSAMPLAELVSVDEARIIYSQCLSVGAARASRTQISDRDAFASAKSSCAEQRQTLVRAVDGNLDVVAALDEIDDESEANFENRTRAIRAMRVAVRSH